MFKAKAVELPFSVKLQWEVQVLLLATASAHTVLQRQTSALQHQFSKTNSFRFEIIFLLQVFCILIKISIHRDWFYTYVNLKS